MDRMGMKIERWGLVAAVLAAGLLAGCQKTAVPEAEVRKTKVYVVPVEPTQLVDRLMIQATIEPWATVRLSAEVPGRLGFVAKREGDAAAKGERLFGIDQATYQARLQEAQARADYQVVYAQRCEKLFESRSMSKDEFDKAVADRQAALAALDSAKVELAKTDVLSPLDGVFDHKSSEVGEFMNTGSPLGTLVDVSRIKVIAAVPEKDVSRVKLGDVMNVSFDALGGQKRQGKVIFIKEVGDPATLTFPVHLEIDNADRRIRPPMIARVELVRQTLSDAVAVPLFAVIPDVVGYHVFVEQNGLARRRDVTLDFPDGDRWHVTGDLKAGDRLIVRGQRDLTDGDAVDVQPMPGEVELPAAKAAGAAGSPAAPGTGSATVPAAMTDVKTAVDGLASPKPEAGGRP